MVADGARARFLRLNGLKSGAEKIEGQLFERHSPPSRVIMSDRPGRTFDSKGHGRHAIQPRSDAHEYAEKQFLGDVIRQLHEAFESGAFDDLIVMSPPRALGIIRDKLPERLSKRVVQEISKDMTKNSDEEIGKVVVAGYAAPKAGREN